MGKANRERRRTKEKARRRTAGASGARRPSQEPPPFWSVGRPPSPAEQVAADLRRALDALDVGDRLTFAAACRRIATAPGDTTTAFEAPPAQPVLAAALLADVESLWRYGWQPVDVLRIVSRRLQPAHRALVAAAVGVELARYPTVTLDPGWLGQVTELGLLVRPEPTGRWLRSRPGVPSWPVVVTATLELLDLLGRLPRLEQFGALPGEAAAPSAAVGRPAAGRRVDDRILSRVRALLAKAESTSFPAEAETFTAGAQALMARHSIDAALLAAATQGSKDAPTGMRLWIDAPYEQAKVSLLDAVAQANRCRVVWSRAMGFCTLVGFRADLDCVETLFTSLLVQATRAMTAHGARADAEGRSRTRSFRQSFLISYALRIGERLEQATRGQTQEAAKASDGGRLLPVLAARDREVDDALGALFPDRTYVLGPSVNDREGWASGRGAADLAAIGAGPGLAAGATD